MTDNPAVHKNALDATRRELSHFGPMIVNDVVECYLKNLTEERHIAYLEEKADKGDYRY